MFATLLGPLPRPPLPSAASALDLVRAAVAAQAEAGLDPLTDGGQWGDDTSVLERWSATAGLTDRAVKAVVDGPYTTVLRQRGAADGAGLERELATAAAATNDVLRALAAAGCPLVEVHEPAATRIGDDGEARRRFVETQRRLLDGVSGIHASLAIVGGNADRTGVETLLAAPFASLALDLIDGPDNWRLAASAPPSTGVVAGALSARPVADESLEVLVWALGYAASTGGRGPDRIGLATAGSLAELSWDVAVRRMTLLGEAVRLATGTPDERAAVLDPRAISIRGAALGRAGIRRARRS